MKSSVIEFNVSEGKGRGAENKTRQITEFGKGRESLNSRSQFKNRQEFTFNRFSSLDKKMTSFHTLKSSMGQCGSKLFMLWERSFVV